MKKFFLFVWDFLKIVIISLAIVAPIRYFLFQPFIVRGQSMEPNFSNGNYLIVDEISYRFRDPQRGEVIVFKSPTNPSQRFIKRIIGLPGETVEIENGNIRIFKNGEMLFLKESYLPSNLFTSGDIRVKLKDNEYFVLGDNRNFSWDSRKFGPISRDLIIGRVFLRAWPISEFSKIEAPAY